METNRPPLLVVSPEVAALLQKLAKEAGTAKLNYAPDPANLVGSAMLCANLDGRIEMLNTILSLVTTQ